MRTICFLSIFICCLLLGFSLPHTAAAFEVTYTYDTLGRLIGAEFIGTHKISYSYDKNGNLLRRQVAVWIDSDGDGLIDALENTTCTDPNDADFADISECKGENLDGICDNDINDGEDPLPPPQ